MSKLKKNNQVMTVRDITYAKDLHTGKNVTLEKKGTSPVVGTVLHDQTDANVYVRFGDKEVSVF